jgi:uncharacterized protein involved in exopolysaccharide biosynthesis
MPAASGTADLSIRDFVAPLFRRKRILIATFLAVLAVGIVLAFVLGPTYSSRMAILVNRERQDPLVTAEATTQLMMNDNPVTPEEINSEVELLSSRDVLEEVVVATGLQNPPPGFSIQRLLHPNESNDDRIARAVKELAKKLKIENIKNSNLIEITYKSPDPQLSRA